MYSNNGFAPQYYMEGSHHAIIPRDLYMRGQEEMVRRANLRSGEDGKKKRIYSSKYALSNLCTCEKCGDIYRRMKKRMEQQGQEIYSMEMLYKSGKRS